MFLCLKGGIFFLYLCFFIPVLLPPAAYLKSIGSHFQMYAFLTLYKLFCHCVCLCVLFGGFFGQCTFKPPVSLKPSWLCADLFLPDNWFSCLEDSHTADEGTDLPGLCMMFLFPGELPCRLMKLVYYRILAANTSNLLK